MGLRRYYIYIGMLASLVSLAVRAESRPVTVFAASSLTTVMGEIADVAKRAGLPACRCVFAASSVLARQIADGAPSDIFISANRQWVDYAVEAGAMDAQTRQVIVHNRLILVSPVGAPFALLPGRWRAMPKLLEGEWLAMGDPAHVPAGIYGAAALKALGVWRAMTGKIARTANVRAALALVARGEARAGIVYGSDFGVTDQVWRVATFPEHTHPPIEYTAVVSTRADRDAVEAYFAFLMSADAQARFAANGFLPASGS
ncbi:MAG: molybdate ABC transporter substrate-binding protein [Gemmatimonadetes bacterium]|nr:molybdate ABC transporter substrate-binding protein [Gemmatimonadota bacterium]